MPRLAAALTHDVGTAIFRLGQCEWRAARDSFQRRRVRHGRASRKLSSGSARLEISVGEGNKMSGVPDILNIFLNHFKFRIKERVWKSISTTAISMIFPKILTKLLDDQVEHFHRDIKTMEYGYQGKRNTRRLSLTLKVLLIYWIL